MSLTLQQEPSGNPDILGEVVSEEKTLSIYNLIMDGGVGGQIIIALLFVLLLITFYIYIERFLAIKAASKIDKNYMNQIKDKILGGNIEAAKILSQSNKTPVARLIEKGISRIG
ncbi:MAG: MotA/TolQ/ExbB proton channel family protein, partial [Flavobacteriaceae bacterium]|nr:MotA/TolQ/ExbB proton channel family protein [Flavobacteriaceae bacterium]